METKIGEFSSIVGGVFRRALVWRHGRAYIVECSHNGIPRSPIVRASLASAMEWAVDFITPTEEDLYGKLN